MDSLIQSLGWALALCTALAALGFVIADRDRQRRLRRKQTKAHAAELARLRTTLERRQQEIDQTEDQLIQLEKMAALGQMVAGVAHEMNNSVSFISAGVPSLERGLAKLVEHIPAGDRDSAEYKTLRKGLDRLIAAIQEGADRSAEIVTKLRTFSRPHRDELQVIDLNAALDSTLALLQHQIRDRIRVVRAYGEIPTVTGFEGQLNQVFMNLLANAVQAIDGEGTITVTTTRADADHVLVAIRDTGSGMSDDVRQRAFDTYFTTKPADQGTGLGLSISLQIIKKHGGSIQLQSSAGDGTETAVLLPLRQADSSPGTTGADA